MCVINQTQHKRNTQHTNIMVVMLAETPSRISRNELDDILKSLHIADWDEVKMAILWQSLGELDVYTENTINTVRGREVPGVLDALEKAQVDVEQMD